MSQYNSTSKSKASVHQPSNIHTVSMNGLRLPPPVQLTQYMGVLSQNNIDQRTNHSHCTETPSYRSQGGKRGVKVSQKTTPRRYIHLLVTLDITSTPFPSRQGSLVQPALQVKSASNITQPTTPAIQNPHRPILPASPASPSKHLEYSTSINLPLSPFTLIPHSPRATPYQIPAPCGWPIRSPIG